MGPHVARMAGQKGICQCFNDVTVNAAQVMRLQGHGREVGRDVSFVLLQARNAVQTIRLRTNQLKVSRKGEVLADTQELVTTLTTKSHGAKVRFLRP